MSEIFRKHWLGLFLVTFLVIMVEVGVPSGAAAENASPQIGYQAPDFTLHSLTERNVNLSRIIGANKVTVINFWGIWCPYCVREIPEFVKFYQQYHQRQVEVLAVNVGDNPKDVPLFAKKNRMNFPILIDQNNAVSELYQITGFPTTLIIDRRGVIQGIIVGATNLSTLTAKVNAVLREK